MFILNLKLWFQTGLGPSLERKRIQKECRELEGGDQEPSPEWIPHFPLHFHPLPFFRPFSSFLDSVGLSGPREFHHLHRVFRGSVPTPSKAPSASPQPWVRYRTPYPLMLHYPFSSTRVDLPTWLSHRGPELLAS